MKFKRLATMLMAAAMMVSLVACTGDNGENSETPVTSGNDVVEETETNHIRIRTRGSSTLLFGFAIFSYRCVPYSKKPADGSIKAPCSYANWLF